MTTISETYYGILIQTEPRGAWGWKSGWDATYSSRRDAEAACKRAVAGGVYAASIISATHAEAKAFGWLEKLAGEA